VKVTTLAKLNFLIFLLFFVSLSVSAHPSPDDERCIDPTAEHQELKDALFRELDGNVGSKLLIQLFDNYRLCLDEKLKPKKKTGKQNYVPSANKCGPYWKRLEGIVLTDPSFRRGLRFIDEYENDLMDVEKKYGVDRFTIASILRTETDFGRFPGDYFVENALYSLYILNPRKRAFALRELRTYLKLMEKYSWPMFSNVGSSAGAFGLPQFIPSSYEAYAVDGDSDGVIDLFNFKDAIYSVANYLKKRRWGKKSKEQYRAIYSYNPSSCYVDVILRYRRELQKESTKDTST
jgi:hypothetical protein